MYERVHRLCPECGGEYQGWVTRCLDCDVALGDVVPSDQPMVLPDEEVPEERRTASIEIGDLSGRDKEILRSVLVGTASRFEMDDDHVWFREPVRPVVEQAIADLRAAESREKPSRRRSPTGAAVRVDRRRKAGRATRGTRSAEGRAAVELARFVRHRHSPAPGDEARRASG